MGDLVCGGALLVAERGHMTFRDTNKVLGLPGIAQHKQVPPLPS